MSLHDQGNVTRDTENLSDEDTVRGPTLKKAVQPPQAVQPTTAGDDAESLKSRRKIIRGKITRSIIRVTKYIHEWTLTRVTKELEQIKIDCDAVLHLNSEFHENTPCCEHEILDKSNGKKNSVMINITLRKK